MPIKAVVFDAGGVLLLVREYTDSVWEQRLGLKKGELTHHLWRSELAQKVKTGQAEPEVLWRHIANMYGLNVDNLRLLRASLHNAEYVNETLVDYIRSLRPHYKTAILSNAWRGSGEVFKHKFHLGQVVDRIMISADLGYAKPDPRIYEHAAQELGITPSEILFIDDTIQNLDSARLLGIATVHFQDTQQTIQEITQALA